MWTKEELKWGRKLKKIIKEKPKGVGLYAHYGEINIYKDGENPSWLEVFKWASVERHECFNYNKHESLNNIKL